MLVDNLPIGASLLAIFDTCHSGTLLDLNHYACNQVWYPWCNNGIPTLSEPRRSVSKCCAYFLSDGSDLTVCIGRRNACGAYIFVQRDRVSYCITVSAIDTAGQQKAIKVDLNFASDAGSGT